MRPNLNLIKATLVGALRYAFRLRYCRHLRHYRFGCEALWPERLHERLDRRHRAGGHGGGVVRRGSRGQKLGGRETLRLTAVLYVISAIGSALAWSWPSLMVFRFLGGLGIGASSVLGPVYIAELAPAKCRAKKPPRDGSSSSG